MEKMDESTRSQFWDRMKKQLLELKSLMSVVKTKCEEMKMKNVSDAVEKALFARHGTWIVVFLFHSKYKPHSYIKKKRRRFNDE